MVDFINSILDFGITTRMLIALEILTYVYNIFTYGTKTCLFVLLYLYIEKTLSFGFLLFINSFNQTAGLGI